jgi:SAM-dependent methyltransferase
VPPPERGGSSAFARSAPYSRYAAVYDEIGQRLFGERIAEATLAYFSERRIRASTMVDLACGTGAASLVFAAAGMGVTGIDLVEEMLTVAREVARGSGIPVAFRQGDIREFTVARSVDLVTCFYDGLNYVTEEREIGEVFTAVRAALKPGGYFVFDLNTLKKFADNWNESSYVAIDRDDMFGLYRSWFQADSGLSPLILTFFVRNAGGSWDRFDEEHIERAYPLATITDYLTGAGFEIVDLLDYADRGQRFGGPGSESSHRVVYVARRCADVAESRA